MPESYMDRSAVRSNQPKNTPFRQQGLKAWRPVLNAKTAFPILFGIGILFTPIGVVLLVTSNRVTEVVVEYTHCEKAGQSVRCSEEVRKPSFYLTYQYCNCTMSFDLKESITGQVYFYYGLSNFYQNHRRYVSSKDDHQLHGDIAPLSPDCEPYRNNPQGLPYAPCGSTAMSLFNDTFTMTYHDYDNRSFAVPMTSKGIAWRSDAETKFGQPPRNSWASYVKPDSWRISAFDRSPNAYSGDEDLLVWMRISALPVFRKLHRLVEHGGIFSEGLPAGHYTVDIAYAYPVTQFGGSKRFIVSTNSWMGGRNPTIGIAYLVVGPVSLLLGFLLLIVHLKLTKRGMLENLPQTPDTTLTYNLFPISPRSISSNH